jgi:hypothetical protein
MELPFIPFLVLGFSAPALPLKKKLVMRGDHMPFPLGIPIGEGFRGGMRLKELLQGPPPEFFKRQPTVDARCTRVSRQCEVQQSQSESNTIEFLNA